MTYTLTDLPFAHTQYDVRVYMKVQKLNETRELWSDYSACTFYTASRTPDNPPQTDIGSFSVNDYNNIYIFWKALPKSKQNGADFDYDISVVNNTSLAPKEKWAQYGAYFEKIESTDTEFQIRSENAVGKSREKSVVRVPRSDRRCAKPINIKKVKTNEEYRLSWQSPYDTSVTSYTVFWCNSNDDAPNRCSGPIDFERVNASTRSYKRYSSTALNMAVSANSDNSSSGMHWAKCTASASSDLNKITTFYVVQTQARFILLKWELQCVEQSLIKGYILHYCPANEPTPQNNIVDCKEPMRSINITGEHTSFNLTGLAPYTMYQIQIQMVSTNATGPMSEPILNTTFEAAPTPPRNLRIKLVGNTSAVLSWERPEHLNGKLDKYIIKYNYDERTEKNLNETVQYELSGLESFKEYNISIQACTGGENACSAGSNLLQIYTMIGEPGIIDQPTIVNDSILLWSPPRKLAGPLEYYQVKVVIDLPSKDQITREVIVRGTKCTLSFDVCQTNKAYIHVRGINMGSEYPEGMGSNLQKRHTSVDDGGSVYNGLPFQPIAKPSDGNTDFKRICVEQVEQPPGLTFFGNYSKSYTTGCKHDVTHSGYMVTLILLILFVAPGTLFIVFALRKFQRMKDISVELPAGLEDIKQEAKGKHLDAGINPFDDMGRKIEAVEMYDSEQEQRLLETSSNNSLEHNSHCDSLAAMDNSSEHGQQTEEESLKSMSENIEKVRFFSNILYMKTYFTIFPYSVSSFPRPHCFRCT